MQVSAARYYNVSVTLKLNWGYLMLRLLGGGDGETLQALGIAGGKPRFAYRLS